MTAVETRTTPDIAGLAQAFQARFLPAAEAFVAGDCSANDLKKAWEPYYNGIFQSFDREVEQEWRHTTSSRGTVESGPPAADPTHALPLSLFPVSVAHNNLDRLVEVLAVELGDGNADGCLPERLVDLAHVVDALHQLLSSLAARA